LPNDLAGIKKCMDTAGIIVFTIIMLHLLIGFGYIAYKFNPKKKGK